jgi:hypothetical protein
MRRAHRSLCLVALVLTAHCGDDTTGRSPVAFAAEAVGVHREGTTSLGWTVRIETATLRLGALRWYEGEPVAQLRLWERALGVRIAHAHPGHYVPGGALADITTPVEIDLVRPAPTALGTARGVSGEARSARVELRPAAGGRGHPGAHRHSHPRRAHRTLHRAAVASTSTSSASPPPARSTPPPRPGRSASTSPPSSTASTSPCSPPPRRPDAAVAFPADGQGQNALLRALRAAGTYRVQRLDTP